MSVRAHLSYLPETNKAAAVAHHDLVLRPASFLQMEGTAELPITR